MEKTSNLFSHYSAKETRLEEFPFRTEAVLQGYIEENPDVLRFRKGDEVKIKDLEKNWLKEDGKKGRIDILASFGDSCGVAELKNGDLDEQAFDQIKGYLSDEAWLQKASYEFYDEEDMPDPVKWDGVLVGTSVSNKIISEVETYNDTKNVRHISIIVIKRYRSGDQIFFHTEVYTSSKSKRDYSDVWVNGKKTNKSRSVLTMVQDYVRQNPTISFSELYEKLWDLRERDSRPIIMNPGECEEKSRKPNRNGNPTDLPYYRGKDAIEWEGGSAAVLGYWTIDEMDKVKQIADTMNCTFSFS